VALVATAVAVLALAEEGDGGAPTSARPATLSVGNPNEGKLVNGRRLPARGEGFYSNPHGPNKEAKYATDEMIDAIIGVGRDVEGWAPGGTLYVNDLGFEEGGTIPHHQSHQAGRDVDFLFYMNDTRGKLIRPRGVHFDGRGEGSYNGGTRGDPSDDIAVRFDTRRNWYVLRSLIENPDAHVQRVFVSEGLRALMLDHASRTRQPEWVIERAGEVMCQPRVPHDDHFHVRLYCTSDDYSEGCRDTWPLYPWRRTELAATGLFDPQLRVLSPRTKSKRARRRPRRRKTPGRLWCP